MFLRLSNTFFLLCCGVVSGFQQPVTNSFRTFAGNEVEQRREVRCIEPFESCTSAKGVDDVIFFPGGNAQIPSDIYNDFLTLFAERGVRVWFPPLNFAKFDDFMSEIDTDKTVVLTHSSGVIPGLSVAEKYNISSVYLLDPVDGRIVEEFLKPMGERVKEYFMKMIPWSQNDENDWSIKLENVKDLTIITAKKSYEWNIFPLQIPFIPAFDLKKEVFQGSPELKVKEFVANDFGHCDILNYNYGNFMHNSGISVGTSERSVAALRKYHYWLSKILLDDDPDVYY